MKLATKTAALCILGLIFMPLTLPAVTGEILAAFPTPGSCPTGLAFDGDNLWIADRKSDRLYLVDPDGGDVIDSMTAPGFQVEGLTVEDEFLWVLDSEEGLIFKFNPLTGITEKTLAAPCQRPQGLAWDGRFLWVADYRDDRLYQVSTEDGTTITDIPSPLRSPYGLAYDGRYLWVSDRHEDMIYMVWPEDGSVIVNFDSPSQFARGLAYDGTYLWNVDYQSDSLYRIKIADTVAYSRTDGRRLELEFTHQFRNYGPGVITEVDIYLALPHDLPFQTLLDTLEFYPRPMEIIGDRWHQEVAHYRYRDIPPDSHVTVVMKAAAELFKTRFYVFPERVGNLEDIPARIKELYLDDGSKYWITDEYIARKADEVVGDETNCYWIARRLFNHVIDNMEYELVGGWNIAPTVLRRGTGSCSEYSFVYIALCRAAGLPARYAGSVVTRGDDASTDDVFHRWVEVYLPGYGWIPVDPSGGDSRYPAYQANAFGYLNNRFLITTIGGGASEYLEWTYNSNEKWKSRGPCKVYSEHVGEWSPIVETADQR